MYNQKIELYKIRDFGELINVTFSFVRQNVKQLFKLQFSINGPLLLGSFVSLGFALYFFQGDLHFLTSNSSGSIPEGAFENLGLASIFYLVAVLGFIALFFITQLIPIAYIKLYQKSKNILEAPITKSEIWKEVKPKILPVFGASILMALAVGAGMFMIVIPGIFLMVSFSLYTIVIGVENGDPIDSLKRSYHLIKGNWWLTFGYIIVIGVILSVLLTVVYVPFYIILIFQTIHSTEMGGNPAANPMLDNLMWYVLLVFGFGFIVQLVNVTITQISYAFMYGNLVEEKEAVGLVNQIDSTLGEDAKEDDA